MSVKDFDPRYLQLWRDASLREIDLPVASREQAINFRQRLYLLRKSMKAEGHSFSDAAQRVKIKIEFKVTDELSGSAWYTYTNDKAMGKLPIKLPPVEWRLRMIPYDQSYDSILERAGYRVPEAPDLS